jgi:hypothetical protein
LQWSKNGGITATHNEAINPDSHNQTSDKGHKYLREKHCAFILRYSVHDAVKCHTATLTSAL